MEKGLFVYSMAIWYNLWTLGNLVAIWYISPRFGIVCQEKSGNPGERVSHFMEMTPVRQKTAVCKSQWALNKFHQIKIFKQPFFAGYHRVWETA
jgi:hypothetical protein